MQPGINRAVPMGILGFIFGAALILLVRWLQSMDPVWDAQIGIIGAGFMSAIFFLWGIGAFNPALSAHHAVEPAEGEEEVHHHEEADPEPRKILGYEVWSVFFWTVVLIASLMIIALIPGGPGMVVSNDPNATTTSFGMFSVTIGDVTFEMSQAIAFLLFVAFTVFSLFLAGGFIGWGMSRLAKSVGEAKKMQPQPLTNYPLIGSPASASAAALPSGTSALEVADDASHTEAPARKPLLRRIPRFVWFLIVTSALMVFFYYVAIGLILPNPNLPGLNAIFPDPKAQLFVLSLINALLFAVIILYPVLVMRVIGGASAWLAKLLRRLPEGLGQR